MCVRACVRVCVHFVRVYTCVCECLCVCTRACVCARLSVCVACVHAFVQILMCVFVHACMFGYKLGGK